MIFKFSCLAKRKKASVLLLCTLGASHDRLAQEAKYFKEFKIQRVTENLKILQGDGVLIFYEVKVVSQLMWSCNES